MSPITAIFIFVVSLAVLLHDVSARAGEVSMGIAVFPNGWIMLRQRSTNVQPMRKRAISVKHVELRVDK